MPVYLYTSYRYRHVERPLSRETIQSLEERIIYYQTCYIPLQQLFVIFC